MATPSLRAAALARALSLVGVHETSENWGPEVKEFLAAANVKSPAPWCAGFVNFCAQKEAEKLGLVSPLEAVALQAYVQSYADYGKKHGWVVQAKDAQPGDLFLLYYDSLHRYGHIGYVTEMKGRFFSTVEGNTNAAGSREGTLVAKKNRPVSANVLFLRWSE